MEDSCQWCNMGMDILYGINNGEILVGLLFYNLPILALSFLFYFKYICSTLFLKWRSRLKFGIKKLANFNFCRNFYRRAYLYVFRDYWFIEKAGKETSGTIWETIGFLLRPVLFQYYINALIQLQLYYYITNKKKHI